MGRDDTETTDDRRLTGEVGYRLERVVGRFCHQVAQVFSPVCLLHGDVLGTLDDRFTVDRVLELLEELVEVTQLDLADLESMLVRDEQRSTAPLPSGSYG